MKKQPPLYKIVWHTQGAITVPEIQINHLITVVGFLAGRIDISSSTNSVVE